MLGMAVFPMIGDHRNFFPETKLYAPRHQDLGRYGLLDVDEETR